MAGIKGRYTKQAQATQNHAYARRGVGITAATMGAGATPATGPIGPAVGAAVAGYQYYKAGREEAKAGRENARGAALDYLSKRGKGFEQANHQYMAQHAHDHSMASADPAGHTSGPRGFANANNQAAAQRARGHNYNGGSTS